MKNAKSVGAAVAAGIGLLACENMTRPERLPKVSSLKGSFDPFELKSLKHSTRPGVSPNGCYLSYRESSGDDFTYARLNIGVPLQDRSPEGKQIRLSLRVVDGDQVMAVAHCLLPDTKKARRYFSKVIAHQEISNSEDAPADHGDSDGMNEEETAYSAAAFSPQQPVAGVWVVAPWTYWYGSGSWDPDCEYSGCWDHTTNGGGGGSGDWNPELTPPPNCFPNVDTLCLTPLNPVDTTTIITALTWAVRPLYAIPDTAVRSRCEAMRNMVQAGLEFGEPQIIYRGAYNTGVPGDPVWHYGETDTTLTKVHIDPWLLDSAKTGNPLWMAQLANTLMHEFAHVMQKFHPQGNVDLPPYGLQFFDPWFNDLNYKGSNPNACIMYNGYAP